MFADKSKAPLPLIHLEADNNAATFLAVRPQMPRDSRKWRVRALGNPARRSAWLPESIEDALTGMLPRFEKFVKNLSSSRNARGSQLEGTAVTDFCDQPKSPTRKARAFNRPSPPTTPRHQLPGKRLRMVFNQRRIVPGSFCGSCHAHGPQAATRNGGDGCKAGVRTLADARA